MDKKWQKEIPPPGLRYWAMWRPDQASAWKKVEAYVSFCYSPPLVTFTHGGPIEGLQKDGDGYINFCTRAKVADEVRFWPDALQEVTLPLWKDIPNFKE